MSIIEKTFRRLFSRSVYKDMKLPLGEMTFTKDFVTDTRGDLYPVIDKSEDCCECVAKNRYRVETGSVERMFGTFFPYASYEVTFLPEEGKCGFVFHIPDVRAEIVLDEAGQLTFACGEVCESIAVMSGETAPVTLIVTLRPGYFDVYTVDNGKPELRKTFESDAFAHAHDQKIFEKGYVCLQVQGKVTVEAVSFYVDSGVSLADIRPIRYENGEVMVEQGRVYLTASIRMEAGMFQGVFAWTPSTSQFEMTGVLFYDSGDGLWCGDVAASVLRHRDEGKWYLWVCSFSHGHILGHAAFSGDPRFGVNVVDITLMDKAGEDNALTDFVGFARDEDPDFYFDTEEKKWYMAICRVDPAVMRYRYCFFTSDKPFEGYQHIGWGCPGAETGGSFQKIDGERVFACGNDFDTVSDYRIYNREGMHKAKFDFPDGGFRGWGSLVPVEMGSRKRVFWITFDRHKGSEYNWSYGNVYVFEAER